ncbi:MAG: DUF2282 domain-containing protein [Proteobacteria bacterium]|nr:DUF2282 domain-containing protein [Pseudomonadota bacterium]
MNSTQLLKASLACALTLGAASAVFAAGMPQGQSADKAKMDSMQKCYGINAAHKNDCKSPGHSCAGQDTTARDPNAFVAVPSGLCEKIDGGKPQPAKP